MSNRKEYMKEYNEKNKERNKEYRKNNSDKIKEQQKENYEKNREQKLKQKKEYYEKNRDKIKEQKKEYKKTPEGNKTYRICVWKRYGIKCDDWNELYDYYIMSTNCEYCWKQIEGSNKHLDHLHSTGEVRGVLCNVCNLKDVYAVKPCQKKVINIIYE